MSSTYRQRPTLRSRLSATALSLMLVAVLILGLIRLGILPPLPRPPHSTTFALLPEGEKAATSHARQTAHAAHRAQRPADAAQPPPPAVPPPVQAPLPFPALALSHDDFAGADVGKIARAPSGGANEGTGADSVAAYGPGEGPGGARLYKAEWYREPPPNALALYLPGGPQPGWALIACRTAPGYHVENCRELDESPHGSGLARALRQAAWQFQVLPPRLGGKPLIGAWVSIRFDFTENRPG